VNKSRKKLAQKEKTTDPGFSRSGDAGAKKPAAKDGN